MKRTLADCLDPSGEEDTSASTLYHLKSQNRSLCLEIARYKRQLTEARKELDLIRRKSREMESLVSIIQRAWSQLDIDASMLLDGLGESEQLADAAGSSELLFRLIHAGSKFRSRDPTDIDGLPVLVVDEWSSSEEVQRAKASAEEQLQKQNAKDNGPDDDIIDPEEAMDIEFGGKVDETLAAHSSFTLSLLERLCVAITEVGMAEQLPDTLGAIVDAKELHAECLSLRDRITKLSAEVITLRAHLHMSEQRRDVAVKTIEKMKLDTNRGNAASSAATSVDGQTSGHADGTPIESVGSSLADAEMLQKLSLLERQLAESEAAKAKAEMTLTERLARPLSQTEAQVADMRRAMEELRLQSRQRVASLIAEGAAMQERVLDLETALMQLEAACESRCSEAVSLAEAEIKAVKAEKEVLRATLSAAKADLTLTEQLKAQVAELQSLESAARTETSKLQKRITLLTADQDRLYNHLVNSRRRELELEQRLGIEGVRTSENVENDIIHLKKAAETDSKRVDEDDKTSTTTETVVTVKDESNIQESAVSSSETSSSSTLSSSIASLTLSQAQARASEAQAELDNARLSLDDLILEIESVSAEESKAREQAVRVLQQMADSQSMQRGVLEENLRLHDQVAEVETKHKEMESKVEIMQGLVKQQDAIITQLRGAEQSVRAELFTLRKTITEDSGKRHVNEQAVLEAEQKLALAEHSIEVATKRTSELQARCDELTTQLEAERRLRMIAQREPKQPKVLKEKKVAKEDSKSSLNNEDAAMLEMTLGMLRCSVCKDRFKNAAITRCFHLFCRECIEENLRNRHRKCPACGDKFGQDDVRNIFFTH